MIHRYLGHQWWALDDTFWQIGANQLEIAHEWAETFISGDFEAFIDDGRRGKISDSCYDTFPKLEIESKSFVADISSKIG